MASYLLTALTGLLLACGAGKSPPTEDTIVESGTIENRVIEKRAEPTPLQLTGKCLSRAEVAKRAADSGRLVELDLGPRALGLVVRSSCVLACRHDIFAFSDGCAVEVGVEYASHVRSLPRMENGLKVLQLSTKSPGSVLEWEVVFDGKRYKCAVERRCRCQNAGVLADCRCESWRPCDRPPS